MHATRMLQDHVLLLTLTSFSRWSIFVELGIDKIDRILNRCFKRSHPFYTHIQNPSDLLRTQYIPLIRPATGG